MFLPLIFVTRNFLLFMWSSISMFLKEFWILLLGIERSLLPDFLFKIDVGIYVCYLIFKNLFEMPDNIKEHTYYNTLKSRKASTTY